MRTEADHPSGAEPPLTVERLCFTWPNGRVALQHCQLVIPRAGLWMLVGSNGSGKSTLLRLIAGLLQPSGGQIRRPDRTALVFQNPDHQLLLPSCGSDLQLGLPQDLSSIERSERVEQALKQVGLAGMASRPIHTLSGGQKQRLAIAGALASGAQLLLLDEPTALLDPDSQRGVLELIHSLCTGSEPKLTALWITHRLEELAACNGAALVEQGHAGPWQSGASLRRSLAPLQGGKAAG
ncbi:ABC transporter ATP-binding protein [Synechococcus sp. CBW1006]|uniref:ABC transporter ATP-binding protein n=1 Tax=Synechococcus sp. CBW1006 TaxID=1353138 RepID=UPI0018CDFF06|nr:ABC transporter ATP-binding protein [Synechococcus sp. CBW1006]QPN67947.1 ABC transporter ATP-binding protein [Synechococcus sp. CBW1006]